MAAAAVPVRVTEVDDTERSCSCWVNGAAESLENFKKFERKLTSFCRSAAHTRNVFAFKENEVVVVKGDTPSYHEVWLRAEVRCVFEGSSGARYKVFLLDYGGKMCVKAPYILPCPGDFADYPYQARLVRLYGLCPTTIDFDLADETAPRRIVRSEEFSFQAWKLVDDLIKNYEKAYFVAESKLLLDDLEICGDLRFEVDGKVISLSDELVNRKFAVKCPEDFEKELAAAKARKALPPEKGQHSDEGSCLQTPPAASTSRSPSHASNENNSGLSLYDEIRKKATEVLNSTNESESDVTPTKSPPVGPAPKGKLASYLSRIAEPATTVPRSDPIVPDEKDGALPPSKTARTTPSRIAFVPAGFEITFGSKEEENPRIVHKAVALPPLSSGGGDQRHRSKTSNEGTSTSDSESASSRMLSESSRPTASESEDARKVSNRRNTLMKYLGARKSNPNSSAENSVLSDDTATGSSVRSDQRPSRSKALLDILSKLKSSSESAHSSSSVDVLSNVSSGTSEKKDATSPEIVPRETPTLRSFLEKYFKVTSRAHHQLTGSSPN